MILAVALEAFGHLGGQFAGRLEDQRARHARPGAAAVQDVDHGQGERCRLAGTGLGTAQYVTAHEDVGNGLRLDRSWCLIARVCDGAEYLGTKSEIFEGHVVIHVDRMKVSNLYMISHLNAGTNIENQAFLSTKTYG